MSTTDELLLDALDKKLLGQMLAHAYARDTDVPAVFLLCTHEWGNIGDLAINTNELGMLEQTFPDSPVYAISRSALAANWERIRRTIAPHDLLAIHGGGNLGDLWPHEEAARIAVVRAFPENRIISLPQSIHFDDPARLEASMAVYRRHPDLLLTVRDDASAEIARTHLPEGSVVRTEDVVSRQSYPFAFRPAADHVLFVQRDDREKRSGSRIDALREAVEGAGIAMHRTDTTVPRLPFSNTELAAKLVYDKIDEMHASNVVVTDRLHGALFALIARRPVIVFENSYGKIGRALQSLLPALGDRIRFADDAEISPDAVLELAALGDTDIDPAAALADAHRQFDDVLARALPL